MSAVPFFRLKNWRVPSVHLSIGLSMRNREQAEGSVPRAYRDDQPATTRAELKVIFLCTCLKSTNLKDLGLVEANQISVIQQGKC